MRRVGRLLACLALTLLSALPGKVIAEEPKRESTPYSVWLDFPRLAADHWARGSLPSWLESASQESSTVEGRIVATTFRLRFLEMRNLQKDMQIRLFFDDREDAPPKISGWSETGTLRFESDPMGTGVGLPTSETVAFSTSGLDFLEITVPGDGTNIRGAFLALMKTEERKRPLDFEVPAAPADAFGNLPPVAPGNDDLSLYGRVAANLGSKTVKLTSEASVSAWDFALESPPLVAIVTFEILGADSLAPVAIVMNRRPIGPAVPHWPDLADPGYRGVSRPLDPDMRFRYSGWLRCQKVIPGSALKAGDNRLVIQLHPESGPVAIRGVGLQLKYNWKNLDYTLAPALP